MAKKISPRRRGGAEHIPAIYRPSDEDRAQLAQVLDMPGFAVVVKMALAECAKFDVRLKNLDPETCVGGVEAYAKLVTEYHRQAKVASMFWAGMEEAIAREQMVLAQPKLRPEEPLPDSTEESFS